MQKPTAISVGVGAVVCALLLGVCLRLFELHLSPRVLWTIAKPCPVLALAGWVWSRGRKEMKRAITSGLVFGAAGDALLTLGRHAFLAGVLAFLCGHLAYLVAFRDCRRFAPGWALVTLGWAAGILTALLPRLGDLVVPVAAYGLVLATVAWRAAARVGYGRGAHRSQLAGALGAFAFLVSDTLLAFARFHFERGALSGWGALIGALVMATYWSGQYGIARSAL